jgi:hypothetical protein
LLFQLSKPKSDSDRSAYQKTTHLFFSVSRSFWYYYKPVLGLKELKIYSLLNKIKFPSQSFRSPAQAWSLQTCLVHLLPFSIFCALFSNLNQCVCSCIHSSILSFILQIFMFFSFLKFIYLFYYCCTGV